MIISASRRTDIPAFYTEWFMNRIRRGFFCSKNPFNPRQVRRVSLAPEDVDAIVFWTKYPAPLLTRLDELEQRGYNYLFHYTLNDYGESFEQELPSLEKRIQVFKELGCRLGQKRIIWRYDPVIDSNLTPLEYHLERFDKIAGEIGNFTFRVVISFLDIYQKTEKKLKKAGLNPGVEVRDIKKDEELLLKYCRGLKEIAGVHNLEVVTCGENNEAIKEIIPPGSCIDGNLINEVFNLELKVKRGPNQREGCLCARSVDMGVYDTCKFNCVYCYAVNSAEGVRKKVKEHNPASSVLIGEL